METDPIGLLRDILEVARLLVSYVKDRTESRFPANFSANLNDLVEPFADL